MEHFTNCAKYNKWRETDKLANLKAALVGDAGQLLWDTAATIIIISTCEEPYVVSQSKQPHLLHVSAVGRRQAWSMDKS